MHILLQQMEHEKFSADVLSTTFPQKKKVLQDFYMSSTNPRSSFDDWFATLLEDSNPASTELAKDPTDNNTENYILFQK